MIIVCVAWFLMTESAAMDDGKSVWVPHPIDGFKLGRIVDIGADGVTVEVTEKPAGQKINAPFDRIYPAEEHDDKDVEDNCKNIHFMSVYATNDNFEVYSVDDYRFTFTPINFRFWESRNIT